MLGCYTACFTLLDRFAQLDGVGLQLDEGVDVVLVRVVDELDLRQPIHERGVAAARRHVRAREGLRLGDEGVREVAHAALLAQRPGLLDEVQAERAEAVLHLLRAGRGSRSGWLALGSAWWLDGSAQSG